MFSSFPPTVPKHANEIHPIGDVHELLCMLLHMYRCTVLQHCMEVEVGVGHSAMTGVSASERRPLEDLTVAV